MRSFFKVTGALIIRFAAGLAAKAVLFLQASGDLGTINSAVYDLTRYSLLTIETQVGRFLAGIFGWDPRPSFEPVAAYLGYLLPVGWACFRMMRTPAAPARSPAAAPAEPVPVP